MTKDLVIKKEIAKRSEVASKGVSEPYSSQWWAEIGHAYVAFVGEERAKGKVITVGANNYKEEGKYVTFDFHGYRTEPLKLNKLPPLLEELPPFHYGFGGMDEPKK